MLQLAKETEKLIRVDVSLMEGYEALKEIDEISEEAKFVADSMLFSKVVDNFQTYVVDLLLLVFTEYPHAFFSKKVDVSRVFDCSSLESLQRDIVEKEVSSLSYKSLTDLNAFIFKATGCRLFQNDLMLRRVAHLTALRNVIVHSRGIVTPFSKERLPHSNYVVGQVVRHPVPFTTMKYLFHCGKHIDHSATSHFSLPAECLLMTKLHPDYA